jgi:hypothetical protein
VRILAIGNMYPPHHLGGYELTWRAAKQHMRAAGHTAAGYSERSYNEAIAAALEQAAGG